jgi:hypothetical protein
MADDNGWQVRFSFVGPKRKTISRLLLISGDPIGGTQ